MVQTRPRKHVELSSDEDHSDAPLRDTEEKNVKNAAASKDNKRSVKAAREPRKPLANNNPAAPATKSTTKASPKKRRSANSKSRQDINANTSQSLKSFFGPASRDAARNSTSTSQRAPSEPEELEDIIDDDSDRPANKKTRQRREKAENGNASRKRSWDIANDGQPLPDRSCTASHKFLKVQGRIATPSTQQIPHTSSTSSANVGPWNQTYAPRTLDELAVHPKKVADVRAWLEAVIDGRLYQRLLILKGPAGAGKSTVISLLSKLLGAALLEWHNPDLSDFSSSDYVSLSSQFADFLSRAGQFQRLDIVSANGKPQEDQPTHSGDSKRVIVIEEFPNFSGSSSTVLLSFRTQILQYLASSNLQKKTQDAAPTPVVISVSESALSSSDSSENLTAHRLLGRDILHHPAVSVIEFNPIAPTFITKALKLALQKHTRSTGRAQPVSPAVLQKLSEIGDVRNAVSTLEYLCRNLAAVDNSVLPPRKSTSKAKAKNSKSTKSGAEIGQQKPADDAAFSLISMRESTLGLFHTVGKIVYNKREEIEGRQADGNELRHRPQPVLGPDALLAAAGTDTSTFLSALHENYILSCTCPSQAEDAEATLDNIEGCLSALGDADVLGTRGNGGFDGARNHGVVSEGLRQDQISFDIGVRGLQAALPCPVKRISAETCDDKRYRPDVHRMFYPTDIKLWRKREEIKDSVAYLLDQAQRGRLVIDRSLDRVHGGINGFPKQSISQPGRMPAAELAPPPLQGKSEDCEPQSGPDDVARQLPRLTALLEHFPYYLMISRGLTDTDRTPSASDLFEDIDQVVRFKRVGVQRDEESDDEDAITAINQRKRFRAGQKEAAFSSRGFEAVEGFEGDVEKLVLSDDDIVDD